MGRLVGLDVGERRIGVAVSDASGTLARPLKTLRTTGLDGDALQVSAAEVARVAAEEPLAAVVIGLPRRLDGSPNEMTPRVARFADRLGQRVGVEVILQDERLTSVEAESRLSARDRDWRSRKDRIDAAAAAIILQDYLDNRASASDATDPALR